MRRVLPALLLAAAMATGCAAARRGADDGLVVATTPIHVVTTPAAKFMAGWRQDRLSTAATAPLFVPLWIAGDLLFTGVAATDLALTPAYAPWKVRPLGFHDTRRFPPSLSAGALEDAGEVAGQMVVFLAPFAAIALACTGQAACYSSTGTLNSDRVR